MSTYETDFYRWTQETVELLKQKKFTEIDLAALIEEVGDIGIREKSEIEEKLAILLTHLLKWEYHPHSRIYHWQTTISFQRIGIKLSIRDSPSLSTYITEEIINDSYKLAKIQAALEMDVDEDIYPSTFEQTGWTIEQILDDGFYPEGMIQE